MKKLLGIMLAAVMLAAALSILCPAAGAADGMIDLYYTQTGKVPVTVSARSENSVTVSWTPVKNADRYALAYFKDGKQQSIKYTEGRTYCNIGGLSKGNCYKFRLYARIPNESGKRVYVIANKKIEVCTYIDTPKSFSTSGVTSDSMLLSWSRTAMADGYQLSRKTGSSWTVISDFDDADKLGCSVSGLDPATGYSFRIRAYRNVGNTKVFSRYITLSVTTKKEALPDMMEVSGANMVYMGESFRYSFVYKDGKSRAGNKLTWSVSSDCARVSADGTLTALKKGDVILTVRDDTLGTQGSMTVHCVKTAADVNFVPMINGIPIANKSYPLPSWYDPGMDPAALAAFDRLAADAAKDGLNIFIISSYRSYTKQQYTYQNWVNIYGQKEADRISARPGFSEHQLGLAIDVNSCYFAFAETKEAEWLDKNCYKYGFILRYPSFESEKYTGYAYEPWHIRYVGTELAKKIYDSGKTLEQYLGITSYYR